LNINQLPLLYVSQNVAPYYRNFIVNAVAGHAVQVSGNVDGLPNLAVSRGTLPYPLEYDTLVSFIKFQRLFNDCFLQHG
jgi:hypothetical protein